MLGLTKQEERFLKKLNTPSKIQEYLDTLPFNHEKDKETCKSPRRTLRDKNAHCMEGALLAACALLVAGEKPFLLSIKVKQSDDDHVVALFKRNGYWGAISKTNHAVLRFRDPIYKTIRELALSYFHEYFLTKSGEKTMIGYSRPINLLRYGKSWITEEDDLWDISESIFYAKHTPIVPLNNKRYIRKATMLERKAANITLP
jgi:hypothetical protein